MDHLDFTQEPSEQDYDEWNDELVMDRVRAARCFLDASRGFDTSGDGERYAFLSLFHPEMTHEQKTKFNQSCHGDA